MLLKEAGTSNLSVISLAEMYDYFDYFGYTNTRLATLQALVGAEVTGVYYGQELSAVGSILISQGVEYNSWNPKLTQSTLKELKDWYDSCNKTVRKISYELENGWGDVITGVTYLSVATVANQQAKAQKVSEGGTSAKGLIGSDFEDYLNETIGGDGSFSVKGRQFDGAVGNRWWEAKSGNYWSMLEENPKELAKFKSDMGNRLKIATENGATYELFSNTPIPEPTKQWLSKKGISFTELLYFLNKYCNSTRLMIPFHISFNTIIL